MFSSVKLAAMMQYRYRAVGVEDTLVVGALRKEGSWR